jgi:tripartite motif-containing protein 71
VFVTKWSTNGSLDGEFIRSQGVAVASDGSIYVSDTNNHQIQKFNSDGVFVIKWGTQGSGDWEFKSPVGVAVAFGGSVYVSDQTNHPAEEFSMGP